jgi:enoyl-CoA hydratase/carnithine racemase
MLNTQSGQVIVERPSECVAMVRLNRPQVRNALNLSLRRELASVFHELSDEDAVRCVVITGDDKAFCAGADLHEYVDASPAEIVARNMHLLWGAIAECPKPVIAAVRGYALGGGCELAMHADIIIAGESAQFGQPEVRVGLMPGGGATQRLTWAVGKFAAMRLLLIGESISAREALSMGLVSSVVSDDCVVADALELAERIAMLAPLAVRFIKESVIESMNSPLDSGLRSERRAFQMLFSTADKTEGISAFLEKRKPVFGGCQPSEGHSP